MQLYYMLIKKQQIFENQEFLKAIMLGAELAMHIVSEFPFTSDDQYLL